MKTHRSYLHVIQKLVTAGLNDGMAHITGGWDHGESATEFCLKNTGAQIEIGSWPVLPIFEHLRELWSGLARGMMRTFTWVLG